MTHAVLVGVASKWLRTSRGCGTVLVERGQREVPDAIGWRRGHHSILVECKMSRADFQRDRLKPWRLAGGMGVERWYLAPIGLLVPLEVPQGWGLLEWDGARCRRTVVALVQEPDRHAETELLVKELAAYQAQGLRYKTFAEMAAAHAEERQP